jgi:hypothetical protein
MRVKHTYTTWGRGWGRLRGRLVAFSTSEPFPAQPLAPGNLARLQSLHPRNPLKLWERTRLEQTLLWNLGIAGDKI